MMSTSESPLFSRSGPSLPKDETEASPSAQSIVEELQASTFANRRTENGNVGTGETGTIAVILSQFSILSTEPDLTIE